MGVSCYSALVYAAVHSMQSRVDVNRSIHKKTLSQSHRWSPRSETVEGITVTHEDNTSTNPKMLSLGDHVVVWMVQSGATRARQRNSKVLRNNKILIDTNSSRKFGEAVHVIDTITATI